jgi:hypothetical protein
MIIHRFVVAEWVITVCISTFFLCCKAQSPDSGQTTVSKEVAIEIAKSLFRSKGVNPDVVRFLISGDVQTIAEWKSRLREGYVGSGIDLYEPYVGERPFWEVTCYEIGSLGAVCHVLVDAVTADVLGVHDGGYFFKTPP